MSITFVRDVLPPPEVVSWSYLLVFDKDPFKGRSPVMFMQRGAHNFLSMPFHVAKTSCNVSYQLFFLLKSLIFLKTTTVVPLINWYFAIYVNFDHKHIFYFIFASGSPDVTVLKECEKS